MSEERKAITMRMSYKTLMALPDSKEKFLALERKLLKLQHHGNDFFEAKEEWRRLFHIYRK
jgi:hypothetical protein